MMLHQAGQGQGGAQRRPFTVPGRVLHGYGQGASLVSGGGGWGSYVK